MPESTILHYQMLQRLGAGGMGVVYKALDQKLQRTVAMKFLPQDLAFSKEDKEKLLREARAASALDHSNVGVIYGIEESAEGELFIVMAYYDGETLAKRLARGSPSLREALDIAIQIAAGLSAAHQHKIVHRDVKPSNIILTKDNVVKIVDFGLARVVAGASATLSARTSGTLPYMSPEQILGEFVDQRCDVWALGVILVEMITGSHPFLRENSTAISFAILNQPPSAMDLLPSLLQPIAYRALSKDPAHRYGNAHEMLAYLMSARAELTGGVASVKTSTAEAPTLTQSAPARDLKQFVVHASEPRWQTAKPKRNRGIQVGAMSIALLVAVILLIPNVRGRLAGLLASSNEKHIAVLPFDNIGGDPANETVAEGLMESLTSQLSNLDVGKQSLWVVPASVVRSRKIVDPSLAAKELGANLVVKGSIQRRGQDIHLTIDLIDTTNLRQIGSSVLEEQTGDLAALQDEAVARLARLMNIKVTAEMLRATGGKVTPAAYESYLKALGYIQRYDKPGNLNLALAALNDAVQTDPRFALGYAERGTAYRLKFHFDQNPKWLEEAQAACEKALQLDDHLTVAFVTLGDVHEESGKHDLAVQEFQRALQINPRDATAVTGMAHAYENAGRAADAEAAFLKAVALRPSYWDDYDELGLFYDRQSRYPEAIAQLQKAIQLTPDNAQAYSNLAAVYLDSATPADLAKAETALKKSIELSPGYRALGNLGYLYLQERRFADSAEMTEKALQLNDKDYLVWENLVEAREWLKQEDKAGSARDRAIQILLETLSMKPQDGQLHAHLATHYAVKKMREEALSHIQTALALAPEDSSVLANVAEAYETLGERAKALHYVDMSLKKGYALDALKLDYRLQSLLADPQFHAVKN